MPNWYGVPGMQQSPCLIVTSESDEWKEDGHGLRRQASVIIWQPHDSSGLIARCFRVPFLTPGAEKKSLSEETPSRTTRPWV